MTGLPRRRVEFDYLRAFIVVLVLCHHAVLAYTSFAFINPENPVQTFSPVVDSQRWPVFDLVVAFNDTFFMSALFLISGLFVWPGLTRKGASKYLSDRLKRLGIPFAVAVPFLIPLAYYPAQLNVEVVFGGNTSFSDFWIGMIRSGFGTAGPLWFLWLLLAFSCLATMLFRMTSRRRQSHAVGVPLFQRPLVSFILLFGLSTVAYLPMAIAFGPLAWVGIGPFTAQASRIGLYLVYFLAGTAVGAYGLENSALRPDGTLVKHWYGWLSAGLISFVLLLALLITPGMGESLIAGLAFTASCAALVFACFAIFLRFVKRRARILDSLSDNAYGIYIVHYAFVTWLQYALLGPEIPAPAKAALVFAGTLGLSWGFAAAIRRIPIVARIL